MYASNDNPPSSRSDLERLLIRSWEYRRPRLAVGVRLASGIFNVALGVLLLALVPRLGPLAWLGVLPLAGAALIFWTVYRLQMPASRASLAASLRSGVGQPLGPLSAGRCFLASAKGSVAIPAGGPAGDGRHPDVRIE